jgi:hypothetical protein
MWNQKTIYLDDKYNIRVSKTYVNTVSNLNPQWQEIIVRFDNWSFPNPVSDYQFSMIVQASGGLKQEYQGTSGDDGSPFLSFKLPSRGPSTSNHRYDKMEIWMHDNGDDFLLTMNKALNLRYRKLVVYYQLDPAVDIGIPYMEIGTTFVVS